MDQLINPIHRKLGPYPPLPQANATSQFKCNRNAKNVYYRPYPTDAFKTVVVVKTSEHQEPEFSEEIIPIEIQSHNLPGNLVISGCFQICTVTNDKVLRQPREYTIRINVIRQDNRYTFTLAPECYNQVNSKEIAAFILALYVYGLEFWTSDIKTKLFDKMCQTWLSPFTVAELIFESEQDLQKALHQSLLRPQYVAIFEDSTLWLTKRLFFDAVMYLANFCLDESRNPSHFEASRLPHCLMTYRLLEFISQYGLNIGRGSGGGPEMPNFDKFRLEAIEDLTFEFANIHYSLNLPKALQRIFLETRNAVIQVYESRPLPKLDSLIYWPFMYLFIPLRRINNRLTQLRLTEFMIEETDYVFRAFYGQVNDSSSYPTRTNQPTEVKFPVVLSDQAIEVLEDTSVETGENEDYWSDYSPTNLTRLMRTFVPNSASIGGVHYYDKPVNRSEMVKVKLVIQSTREQAILCPRRSSFPAPDIGFLMTVEYFGKIAPFLDWGNRNLRRVYRERLEMIDANARVLQRQNKVERDNARLEREKREKDGVIEALGIDLSEKSHIADAERTRASLAAEFVGSVNTKLSEECTDNLELFSDSMRENGNPLLPGCPVCLNVLLPTNIAVLTPCMHACCMNCGLQSRVGKRLAQESGLETEKSTYKCPACQADVTRIDRAAFTYLSEGKQGTSISYPSFELKTVVPRGLVIGDSMVNFFTKEAWQTRSQAQEIVDTTPSIPVVQVQANAVAESSPCETSSDEDDPD